MVSKEEIESATIDMEVGRRGLGRVVRRAIDEGLREEIRILTARFEAVEAGRRMD